MGILTWSLPERTQSYYLEDSCHKQAVAYKTNNITHFAGLA